MAITEPNDSLPVGDAVEAKILAQRQPGRQLAKRRRLPNGGGEIPCSFSYNWRRSGRKPWANAIAFWSRPASHMMASGVRRH